MPYVLKVEEIPAGYTASPVRKGEQANIITSEFVSSEDGDSLINRLEGFPTEIIETINAQFGADIRFSLIDNLLVVIGRDRSVIVYINELTSVAKVKLKRSLEAGDLVRTSDIASIEQIDLRDDQKNDISIPPDSGVLILFSAGWRKGLFYDYSPLVDHSLKVRGYDLNKLLGGYQSYLLFQHLFKIADNEWDALIARQWFPFISLKPGTVKEILGYLRSNWDVDELVEKISKEVDEALPGWLEKWGRNQVFKEHIEIIQRASDRYGEGDFISANSILYPRIEGIMRSNHLTHGLSDMTQKNLVTSVIKTQTADESGASLLLPKHFQRFLEEVYFAKFDPLHPDGLSRNTLSHGVAPKATFSQKSAMVGFLILDQISFYVG